MQTGSGAKNPPWARSNVNTNMTGMNTQIMDPNSMMTQQGMMPFQQTQAVFNPSMMQAQSGMSMPMAGQMQMNQMAQGQMYPSNVVAYPTPRAMNPGMYQSNSSGTSAPTGEQRVFTGTVTKTHNDFGFVDHDVFYQTSVCAKGIVPKVNDRVLVEANYNPNMPFKWNATRVQVLPKNGPANQKQNNPKSNNYNAVPPPANKKQSSNRRDDRLPRRDDRKRSRTRSRSRSRTTHDNRTRRDSPPRKRPVIHQPSPVKYVVRVPRMPLDIDKLDVPTLSQRYTNLYVPSDFFNAQVKWGETFPPQSPLSLNNPCQYYVMSKDIENPLGTDAVLEPPDADYRFSAKVMLISLPTLESLYQKCGLTKVDDKDKRNNSKTPLHPTRLIKFLVGQKGKGGENFAIGGPWSPSLDGENPQSDPSVLVKTAIRTCKALTGIDLSNCAQWYRMVEFYYWRESSGGKSRLECVVLFLPDVWSSQPSRIEWANVQETYKTACDNALRTLEEDKAEKPAATPAPAAADPEPVAPAADAASADKSKIDTTSHDDSTITIDENDDDEDKPEPTHYSKIDLRTIKVDQLRQELRARNVSCKGLRAQLVSRLSKLVKQEEEKENKSDDVMEVEDEEAEGGEKQEKAPKPADDHIEISDDKEESPAKVEKKDVPAEKKDVAAEKKDVAAEKKDVTAEKKDVPAEKKDVPAEKKDVPAEKKDEIATDKKEEKEKKPVQKSEKEIEQEMKKLEKEKQTLRSRYEVPNSPHILVHPSTTAKGGKFTCNIATLSFLLDYRVTDNKEHSFELFVFAELLNEMLMRDFGFYIYKTLYTLPEKVEEVKEVKEVKAKESNDAKDEKTGDKAEKADKKEDEKKEEKKEDKKEDKKDDKKDEKDRKEDRRDDRRESRRRDRRESHSDDERSSSPRRKSRGVELPPDPYLLLSLVYFDTARCGHITKKDLQNLFMSLGLKLSRSQIRAILEKVCIKDNFSYKSLVQAIKDLSAGSHEAMQDLPLDTIVVPQEVPSHIAELEAAIAAGNRDLLPVFNRQSDDESASSETKDVSDKGVVVYKSRVIDVGALVLAEARNSAARAKLESALETARAALNKARQAAATTQQAERGAHAQLSELADQLAAARARVTSLTASSKIFHSALKSIQSKVEAVVNIKYEDDDVVEIVNGPSKVEKVPKKEEIKVQKEEPDEKLKVDGETPICTEKVDSSSEEKETNKDIIASENMEIDDKE